MTDKSNPFQGMPPIIQGSGQTGEGIVNDNTQLPTLTEEAQANIFKAPQDRQPPSTNYLYQTNFRFLINRLPKMEFFIQRVNLPGFGAGSAQEQPTRFVFAKHPNNKVNFDELAITFLVDEDMGNWIEIYNWMKTIYLIKDHKEFESKITSHFTDGSLMILNSATNVTQEIRFKNLLPVSLTGLDFDSTITDLTPFTAEIRFAYDYYEFV